MTQRAPAATETPSEFHHALGIALGRVLLADLKRNPPAAPKRRKRALSLVPAKKVAKDGAR